MILDKETLKKLEEKAAPKQWHPDNYPFTIRHCPGWEGYQPENLEHNVCKWCGQIKYYH